MQLFIYVFSFCSTLGIKKQVLVFLLLLFLLLLLDLPPLCRVLSLLVASQRNVPTSGCRTVGGLNGIYLGFKSQTGQNLTCLYYYFKNNNNLYTSQY